MNRFVVCLSRDMTVNGGENVSSRFIRMCRYSIGMSAERRSVPVSLPSELVRELDELVEKGVFSSRSDALRYGARLVVREEREHLRLHELTDELARRDVETRMERKRVS